MMVDLSICEIENLLMMHERVKQHYNHGYAKSAIKKLNAARKEYMKPFTPTIEDIEQLLEQDEAKLF